MGRRPVHWPQHRRGGRRRARSAWLHPPAVATLLALPGLTGCLGPLPPGSLPLAGALIRPALQRDGCPRLASLDGSQTPEQLYQGVVACLQRSDRDSAVVLFSLAAAYGRYDALRVADPTAHQAGTLMRLVALQQLDEPQRQALSQGLAVALEESGSRPDLCAAIERVGPPRYRPDYMLNHGRAGLRRSLSGDGGSAILENDALRPDFDGDAAWNQVLDGFLRCSKA